MDGPKRSCGMHDLQNRQIFRCPILRQTKCRSDPMNLSFSALDMKRFWATIFLALVVVGGSWILLNQDQIKQAGGLGALLNQQLKSDRSFVNNVGPGNAQSGPFRQASTLQSNGRSNGFRNGSYVQAPVATNRIRIASFKLAAQHRNRTRQ